MEIVGIEGADGVHTIDMWFSARRGCWVVERRDADGAAIGFSFCAPEEDDAAACLVEWLRAHGETHLVGRAVRMIAARAQARAEKRRSAA